MKPKTNCARAFTLIELLLVICIVMILLGLLLPALANTRDASLAAHCASNQHHIGLALAQFGGDNHDLIPREGQAPWRGPLGREKYIPWINAVQPYIEHDGADALASPVFLDPAHPNPNHRVHYVVNGIGFAHLPRGLDVEAASRRPALPLSHLHRPSEMMYLTAFVDDADNSIARNTLYGNLDLDAGTYDVWNVAHLLGPERGANQIADNVRRVGTNRHGRRSNVLFADGHVDERGADTILTPEQWYDGVPWDPHRR